MHEGVGPCGHRGSARASEWRPGRGSEDTALRRAWRATALRPHWPRGFEACLWIGPLWHVTACLPCWGPQKRQGGPPERHAPGLTDIPLSRLGHCTSLAAPSPPRGPAWPVLLSSKEGDSSSSAPEPQALGEQRPCRGYPEHLGGCPSTAG